MNIRTVDNSNMFDSKLNYSNYLMKKYGVDREENDTVKKAIEDIKKQSLTDTYNKKSDDKKIYSSDINNCYTSNITSKNIIDLKASDNTMTLRDGNYYKTTTSLGKSAIISLKNGIFSMPSIPSSFTNEDTKEISSISEVLTSLVHNSTTALNVSKDSKNQVKAVLDKLGIKSGYFDVKSDYGAYNYFEAADGTVITKNQADSNRKELNNINWFDSKYGCTKDSTITVEGKDYKVDENGHINIPENQGCIKENIKINK